MKPRHYYPTIVYPNFYPCFPGWPRPPRNWPTPPSGPIPFWPEED